MNSIDNALSSRFRLVSSVALISVIIIHSKFIMSRWEDLINTQIPGSKASWFIQFLLSENIARIAVPVFFFISGFFIAQNYDQSFGAYKNKIIKRIKSLLIPYLSFCILWFIPYRIHDNSISILNAIIHPVPYQFWFIQHLMILSLSFGILYWLKQFKYIILPILLFLYLTSEQRWGGFEESLLFYMMGICFSNIRIIQLKQLPLIFLMLTVTLILSGFIFEGNILIHHLMVLCGTLSVIFWLFSSSIIIKSVISPGLAFFIFACHEPTLSILKTVTLQSGLNNCNTLLLYFTLPAITIFLCISLYKITTKLTPGLLRIITGNRLT